MTISQNKLMQNWAKQNVSFEICRSSVMLEKRSAKTALKAAGIAASAGGATLSLMLSPTTLMPVLLCLSLIGGVTVPGLEIYREWMDGWKEQIGQ
jgi:hypothetical protein